MSPEPCKAINAKEILSLYIAFNVPVLYKSHISKLQ